MRIPFDSLCLAAVVDECQPLVGGRVQKVVQWDATTIGLGIYHGREEWLLISADATYCRMHLMTRRPVAPREPPPFCMSLRKHLTDAHLQFVCQRGLDRVVDIGFSTKLGPMQLVVEIMGKHSNLILVDAERTVLGAAKVVGVGKSKRPIVPGRAYEPPPFEMKPSLLEAKQGDDVRKFDGGSPFLRTLIGKGFSLTEVQNTVRDHSWKPQYAEGSGAYPLSVQILGLRTTPRDSISQAIEQHTESLIEQDKIKSAKSALASQVRRVLEARTSALTELDAALDAAGRARELQEKAELILAFQNEAKPGDKSMTATSYDGRTVTIQLNPEKSAVENANAMFEKARKAKDGAEHVKTQKVRLQKDKEDLLKTLYRIEIATDLEAVAELREDADKRRWLHHHSVAKEKEKRPYEGHSIRELVSPGGWRVLYGENAASNDYLTTKVAKPNDYWFHVRGVTSAHVVLQTHNHPTSVQSADMMFAAKLAVSKSASKHSTYVAVDYTLKKYVRKQKSTAPGLVTYSNEKVLHVEQ